MPRILVDLLFYTGTKGGMESYVRNLYGALGASAGDFEYVGLISREAQELDLGWFPGTLLPSKISGDKRASWAWGELTVVARSAKKAGADLIHAPANLGPLRSSVPVVLTVHDLLPFVHPEWVPGPYAPVLRALISGAARNAKRLLTVSRNSAADVENLLHVDSAIIDVVPLAGRQGVPTRATGTRDTQLVLSLGNRMPHKNFETLLTATSKIPDAERPRLVITGSHGDDPLRPMVEQLGIGSTTSLLGWVEDSDVERLYAEASVVVVPTLFEGFGLPVLEAMSRGCPVICSDLPVLREIAGETAIYVDPRDPGALAERLEGLLADSAERERMSAAALLRASTFSWSRTAELTAESFHRALA